MSRPWLKEVIAALLLAACIAAFWTFKLAIHEDAHVTVAQTSTSSFTFDTGQPFDVPHDAGPISTLLYPPRLVNLALGSALSVRVLTAVHIFAAGLFMYILLRVLGAGRLSGLCGGATFMLNGAMLSSSMDSSALFTLCYAPLMLALTHKTVTRGGLHWPVLTGLATALQLTAGFPQIALYTIYLVCAYALVELTAEYVVARRWHAMWQVSGKLCIAAVTAACIAAPYLWLWAEWRIENGTVALGIARAVARTAQEDMRFGAMLSAATDPEPVYGLRYQYLGLVPLILGTGALVSSPQRRRMLAMVCVGAAGLVMSTGSHSWLYNLYSIMPTGKWFAAPYRLYLLWMIAVSILAGMGLNCFEQPDRQRSRHRRRMELGVVCAIALLVALVAKPPGQLYMLALIFCLCTIFTVTNRTVKLVAEIGVVALILFDLTHAVTFRPQILESNNGGSAEARTHRSIADVQPRAYVVDRFEVIDKPEEVFARVVQPDFDPYEMVIVDRPPAGGAADKLSEPLRARIEMVTFDRTVVSTPDLETSGILVLADRFYPGTYDVFVDGLDSTLLHADHVFRAVSLPPGRHTVRVEHELTGWRTGRWISLCGLAILLSAGVVELVRNASREQPQEEDTEPVSTAG